MHLTALFLAASTACGAWAAEWPFDVTTIKSSDGSISASFVSLGATLTQLWVKDKAGKARDVVLGYDDPSQLLYDPDHPVFNAIVGRYANRIRNGTFSIPITKEDQPDGPGVYHIPKTGAVTLHAGTYGWDRRDWTVVAKSATSVTYKHLDLADEGFPGIVNVWTTHTVSNGGVLKTTIHANATEKTPIMLTQHVYWNLDAFQGGLNDTLNHILRVDASKVIELDGNKIPTGKFINVENTPFDFRKAKAHGTNWNATQGLCIAPCWGFDHAWVYDKNETTTPGVTLYSPNSGIKLDITTNQPVTQVYSAYWLNTPRKAAHGGPTLKYGSWAGIAIEQEGYLDAINTPEWNIDQIYEPGKEYDWSATYKFSIQK